ncbi:MAG TPA: TlpA disulfide reductase family protein [Flavobacterium sp.]|jgi:thiol-disulfide isomerase/thioredoxin|nr:TlpA disulfide reductase family protein [Flavobacterium sp.]
MKNIFLVLLVATAAVSCSQAQKSDFSAESHAEKLTTLDGSQTTFGDILKKHKGKAVVIEVWASWCGDCVKAMPKLKELQAAHPEVDYVFVSMDKADDKWKAGIQKHNLQGDHYWVPDGMKGSFGKAIDLDWIPRYIIVDKTGKVVVYRAIETDFDKINSTLNQIK